MGLNFQVLVVHVFVAAKLQLTPCKRAAGWRTWHLPSPDFTRFLSVHFPSQSQPLQMGALSYQLLFPVWQGPCLGHPRHWAVLDPVSTPEKHQIVTWLPFGSHTADCKPWASQSSQFSLNLYSTYPNHLFPIYLQIHLWQNLMDMVSKTGYVNPVSLLTHSFSKKS